MADFGYQNAGMAASMAKGAWDAVGEETAVVPLGPFETVGRAFEDVHVLARRISLLADRLVGAEPQDASAGHPVNQPQPPLLLALHLEANRASQSVRDANYALSRIENLLS